MDVTTDATRNNFPQVLSTFSGRDKTCVPDTSAVEQPINGWLIIICPTLKFKARGAIWHIYLKQSNRLNGAGVSLCRWDVNPNLVIRFCPSPGPQSAKCIPTSLLVKQLLPFEPMPLFINALAPSRFLMLLNAQCSWSVSHIQNSSLNVMVDHHSAIQCRSSSVDGRMRPSVLHRSSRARCCLKHHSKSLSDSVYHFLNVFLLVNLN